MRFFVITYFFMFHCVEAVTLRDALAAAYKNNRDLMAARQEVIAFHENIVQAKKGFRPSIQAKGSKGFAAGRAKSNANSISRHSTQQTQSGSVQASQNLFRGGADLANVNKVEFEIKAKWAQLKDNEQKIMLKVVQAYLDLYVKYANLETYKANLISMKRSYEAARDKKNIGEETLTNEAAAEAKYAQAKAQLENANAELESAKASFEQLTFLNAPCKVGSLEDVSEIPNSVEEFLESGVNYNPTIEQAKAEYESAKSGKKIYTGYLMPSVDLNVSSSKTIQSPKTKIYGNTVSNSTEASVNNQAEISVTIPLYEQGDIRSKRRQAKETIVQKRIAIESVKKSLEQSCRQVYLSYLAAKANLKNNEVQLKSQEIAVESINQEVAVGSKVLTDLLIQQTNLLAAKLERIKNIQAYYNSMYQILALQGKLTGQALRLPVEYFKPEVEYENIKNNF